MSVISPIFNTPLPPPKKGGGEWAQQLYLMNKIFFLLRGKRREDYRGVRLSWWEKMSELLEG